MDLRIHQKLLCTQLGCDHLSLVNWELNHTEPALKFMPGIVEFLGYDPLPKPTGLMDRLQRFRLLRGWTIPVAATALGVHPDTLRGWLAGQNLPSEQHRQRVKDFLDSVR